MAAVGPGVVCADASFLLNLAATGEAVGLLRAVDVSIVAHADVLAEAQFLIGKGPDGEPVRDSVDHTALRRAGLLDESDLDATGNSAFVRAAPYLTDRDAKAVALAHQLRVRLATDDRRMRKVAGDLFPEVALVSTLEFLKAATDVLGAGRERTAALLRRVRIRGNFAPPRHDPLAGWYRKHLADA